MHANQVLSHDALPKRSGNDICIHTEMWPQRDEYRITNNKSFLNMTVYSPINGDTRLCVSSELLVVGISMRGLTYTTTELTGLKMMVLVRNTSRGNVVTERLDSFV